LLPSCAQNDGENLQSKARQVLHDNCCILSSIPDVFVEPPPLETSLCLNGVFGA
jgi:hypothetical protein